MNKKQVITRFCALSTKVNNEIFQYYLSTDCFCGENNLASWGHYSFDPEIIEFIEKAVEEKIEREIKTKQGE